MIWNENYWLQIFLENPAKNLRKNPLASNNFLISIINFLLYRRISSITGILYQSSSSGILVGLLNAKTNWNQDFSSAFDAIYD